MSGRMVDQPPSDVHTLATEALQLLVEPCTPVDRAAARSLLKRIQAIAAGVREAQEDEQ